MKVAQVVRKQKMRARVAMARSAARKAAVARTAEMSASRGLEAKPMLQKQLSASVARTSVTAP